MDYFGEFHEEFLVSHEVRNQEYGLPLADGVRIPGVEGFGPFQVADPAGTWPAMDTDG